MKEVTVQELKRMRDNHESFQLIDVREQYEADIAQIGGELIPMTQIMNSESGRIAKDKPVIIHCRSGARSATVILALEKQYGFTNLFNLKGGILAWAKEIDPSVATY
ncbi:MAG TPA: rhodanese-like domain-containing protein [Bacteroidia bacterium]|nr:rhodanese-like domain-containing protein [Bacteroidia bacterium]